MASAAPARAALTEAPRLVAVYDLILSAKFDEADAALAKACPPAPREACLALAGEATWWRIQIDPANRSLDEQLQRQAQAAIDAAEAWTRRDPQDAEAWFYLAGGYAPLVEWRVLRGQRLGAARDGNRIRVALEHALARDPTLNDAYFGIGLYHYYAAVAPAAAKVLRWLLLMPGGDQARGLAEIARARDQGLLLKGEADYQLQRLYLWYEHRTDDALALLADLDARYPTNPIFLQRIAEVESTYRHDRARSVAAWTTLLDRARHGRVACADLIAKRAARALDDDQNF